MLSPEERVKILQSETKRIQEYLRSLPEEAWSHPSACDGWTVADVVAHLTGHSNNYPPRIGRAVQGDASPDAAAHRRFESGQMDPEETEDQAIALRQELGDQLLSEFVKGNQAMDQVLAEVGPEDWDKLVYRTVGTESLRNIVDVFITERAVHGWDVRSRFDSQAGLPPECVPIIVERIPQRPRWWSFRTEADFSLLPLRYRFEINEPAHYVVDIVVTEEHQYMEVASKADAQVTIRCDGETFVLLMYGRIKPGAAIAEGRAFFEGDQQLVTAFAERFKGG